MIGPIVSRTGPPTTSHAVRWDDAAAPAACAVCGSTDTRVAAHVDGNGVHDVAVVRCGDCASLRLVGEELQYSDAGTAVDDYVEGGVGVDAIASALGRVRRDAVRRFLDVGCYYGIGVHLGQQLFGWDGVGVEPSGAGRRGAAELGVDIRAARLDELTDLGTFDFVMASEVVEHVDSPVAFLASIRDHLAEEGLLVLTTPAAEVVTPAEPVPAVLQALSPGHHRFLASAGGLRMLLEGAGFLHHDVVRDGASLYAVAATSAAGLSAAVRQPTVDQARLLDYLDRSADEAPPGSALALGMAARHFRAAVTTGDLRTADKSFPRLRDVLRARHGFDLGDPRACTDRLDGGARPSWSLPGAAYSAGLLAFAGSGDPVRAAACFELGARAATAWTEWSGSIDVDVASLRELSIGHCCLALARFDAGKAARAARELDGELPGDPERTGWWRTRTLNELIARGHLDVAPDLLDAVQGSVEALATSPDPDYRRAGLDALFLLGIRALNSGSPTIARAWFQCCAGLCDTVPGAGDHARRLAADAHAHDAMAAARGGIGPSVSARPPDDPRIVFGLDAYWSDASGFYVRGFAHAGEAAVTAVGVHSGGRSVRRPPSARPDVAACYPDGSVPPNCGFALYLDRPPASGTRLELETSAGSMSCRLDLPDHPLPQLPADEPFDYGTVTGRMIAEAPPGPFVALGWRVDAETDLAVLRSYFGSRRVVDVDIHPGPNVDVVGDAHRLSRLFRGGSFAGAVSAALLEHVVAPWLVAAELNAVLATGALVLQIAPTTWPEHASPNDFWRFTADGLAVLFGPATGYEVIAKGTVGRTRVHPDPSWRDGHLDMPTIPASDQSWVLARKVAEIQPGAVGWPYDPVAGERLARGYPADAIGKAETWHG